MPDYVGPDPQKPDGRARALCVYENGKDPLYRIRGTNQPEYIGQAICSGCTRMTNENVIDRYKRVKPGAIVVVLALHTGNSPYSRRVASMGGAATGLQKRRPQVCARTNSLPPSSTATA